MRQARPSVALILLAAFLVLAGSGCEAAPEEQKANFERWYVGWKSTVSRMDSTWNEGVATFVALNRGTITQDQARQRLSALRTRLQQLKKDFEDMDAPEGLSRAHKRALKGATKDMAEAMELRAQAVKLALDWFNDPTDINTTASNRLLKEGDRLAVQAVAAVVGVGAALDARME
ncbi:MAG: hypothetical protein NUV35_07080 [Syntrophomonadaceae bacterium]|nr:hypothetical protein [Syntrophomonadaceae bacterium]